MHQGSATTGSVRSARRCSMEGVQWKLFIEYCSMNTIQHGHFRGFKALKKLENCIARKFLAGTSNLETENKLNKSNNF